MVSTTTPQRLHARFSVSLPVLMKEMRSRMRGSRTPMLLFAIAAISIFIALLVIVPQWSSFDDSPSRLMQEMPELGKALFLTMLFISAGLCALITPIVTGGAIASEREQQTLEFLLLTRISSTNIVLGKLISALSFIVIIQLCVMPVIGIAFMLGGVDPLQLVGAVLVTFTTCAMFGAVGLYCSARFPKAATASIVALGGAIISLGVIPLAFAGYLALANALSDEIGRGRYPLSLVLPIIAVAAVVAVIIATYGSVILSVIVRRPLPLVVNVIIWLVIAFTLAIIGLLQATVHANWGPGTEAVFLGNPVFALILATIDDARSGIRPWVGQAAIPAAIAANLLGAWVFGVLAVRLIQRMRGGR